MLSRKEIQIKQRRHRGPRKVRVRRFLIRAALVCFALSLMFAAGLYYYLIKDLPTFDNIADYKPNIITKVYSDDNTLIGEFAVERREVIPISKVPPLLIQAFVAAEDDRFFEHEGIDFFSILRAFIKNLKAGGVVQGGSTITQQVAKSLLTSERTFERKAKEAILAYRIEKNFSKNEILYLYLNQIYLGHGAYGVQAAAQNYFHKDVGDLTLAEMSILAGLPQAPSKYSPSANPEKARERQNYVLNRMAEEGYINIVEATDAMNTPIEVYPVDDINNDVAPYFTEHVRRYLEKKYGADMLYNEGLTVFTTVNVDMQTAARKALREGLFALDKRQGYRGAIHHVSEENIEEEIAKLQEKLEKKPIKEGEIYEGVVVEVNSGKKYTEVRLGPDVNGRISLDDMAWARKPDPEVDYYEVRIKNPADVLAVGDVIYVKVMGAVGKEGYLTLSLYQEPLVQGAVLSLDPENGFVKTMVGGFDFVKSKFNRAVQSRRQPGSAFKPIIYSAAIDKGYTPATIIMDSPIIYKSNEDAFAWKPKNYEDKFYGPTTLRTALTKSRNVVTIKIVQDLGLDYVINYARRLGIRSHLNRDLSLSLGSSGVSLLELTSAYSVFPAQGVRHEPIFITKIMDRDGNILEELSASDPADEIETEDIQDATSGGEQEKNDRKDENNDEGEQADERMEELPDALKNLPEDHVISPQTAYIMTSLLENVVQRGTGWRAKALKRPVAGKTGTTNDLYDAWFMGFTPNLVTGTWVGFDQEQPLGKNETGSRAASPIFVNYMQEIYKDKPIEAFPVPEGIVFAKIDTKTGLLAAPSQAEDTFFECFREGTAPSKVAAEVIPQAGDFFRQDL